jgi:hypothetical protein
VDGKTIVAIPWYLRTDYVQAKALFGDMPESYEGWLERALQWEADCKAQGQAVSRVVVRSGAFRTWCQTRGMAPDTRARTNFISKRAWNLMQQQG